MAKNISAIRFYWVFFFFPPFFDTVNLKDLSEITHVPFTKWPRSVQVFIENSFQQHTWPTTEKKPGQINRAGLIDKSNFTPPILLGGPNKIFQKNKKIGFVNR